MKKTIFSALFVGLFGFYAITQRTASSLAVVTPSPEQVPTSVAADPSASNSQTYAPIVQATQQNKRNEDENEFASDEESETRNTNNTPRAATPIVTPVQPKPVVAPAPKPTPAPAPVAVAPANATYKDGTFTGPASNAYYGYVQVQVTTQNDRVTAVAVLQYPNDRHESVKINSYALPILKSEAIAAQTAQIDMVSGATDTSDAFIQSLTAALSQAHV